MNEWFVAAGLSSWKPLLTALLLPPTPFLLLLLVGLRQVSAKRSIVLARVFIGGAVILIWLSSCHGAGESLARFLAKSPPVLTPSRIAELRSEANGPVAIIILGSGLEDWAPEYATSSLSSHSLERLRFGVWLARQSHWPAAFSGGVGWGQAPGGAHPAEATIAQRIASQEFGVALRWVEPDSRDTRENAVNTLALLRKDGITHVLLVTHYWHMARALRNFQRASNRSMTIEAAPMGLAMDQEAPLLRWFPSADGLTLTRQILREQIGLWSGA